MPHPATNNPAILAIFVLTYAGLAIGHIPGLRLNRTGIAVLGAIGVMIFSGNSSDQIVATVSWPTVLLLFGFFVLSAQLRLSGVYNWIAHRISSRIANPGHFLIYLILVTAGLSAFLNHDIVCFVLTPVLISALVRKNIDPVPFLVAMATASDVGAGATLIGSAQNMMIGTLAGLSFARYILWSLVPVAIGLLGIYAVVRILRREHPPAIDPSLVEAPEPEREVDRYHAGKGIFILLVVFALFFTSIPREVTVLVAAGIHLLSHKFRTEEIFSLVDWEILILFMALFVVSGAFQETGYGATLVHSMVSHGFDPVRPANEAVLTSGLSILINNAPAVMLLVRVLPIAHATTAYIIAIANSFAGSTIITASVANIIVVQQARRHGIVISFGAFARFGVPITVIGVAGLIGWEFFVRTVLG